MEANKPIYKTARQIHGVFSTIARYRNRMKEYLGSSPYWCMNTGYQYTKQNNAPVPVSIYTKND